MHQACMFSKQLGLTVANTLHFFFGHLENKYIHILKKIYIVRRGKVWSFNGCKSRPANSVAPAGSYRSGGGGNEAAGAFEKTGRS